MHPDCPQQCDCRTADECLFGPPAPERPSYAIVWIAAAVTVAIVVLVILLV